MAYENKAASRNNLESSIEIFSMMGQHGMWLSNFYSKEMATACKFWQAYSSSVMKDMGSLAGSLAQTGMENMKMLGKFSNSYSQKREEPYAVKMKIVAEVPVIQEKIVMEQTPRLGDVIVIENPRNSGYIKNKRMQTTLA